jgi:hypothetical protein
MLRCLKFNENGWDVGDLFLDLECLEKRISLYEKNTPEFINECKKHSLVSRLLENQPRCLREIWFTEKAYSYMSAIEKEDYEFAEKLLGNLIYFQENFLKDSNIYGEDLDNNSLKLLGLYDSEKTL